MLILWVGQPIRPFPVAKIKKFLQIRVLHVEKPTSTKNYLENFFLRKGKHYGSRQGLNQCLTYQNDYI